MKEITKQVNTGVPESGGEREIALQLSGVSKLYRLGQIGGGTLQSDLQSWWAGVRGREDPNRKIGERSLAAGQEFLALDGIDLTVYQGEALGIIGSNGAGKSTLLKLISRITAPTEGKIRLYGRVASMLEVGTGFNQQMTGRENIYMNGAILGMSRSEIDAKLEDIIEFSEVREFIDTPVKRYSSGMYVKLAFAVAAHLDSEIMIMDEVLAVGDMAFQKKCLEKMRTAATEETRTVLYVSHNMNTIRQLCDRCIVLSKGRIIYDGDVETAIRVYLGSNGEMRSEYIYGPDSHKNPYSREWFRIQSSRLLEREEPICEYGETLALAVNIATTRTWEQVFLRLEVKYADDSPLGIAFSSAGMDYAAGKETTVRLSFDTTHLAPGRYHADLVAYCVDGKGLEQYIDGVYPFLTFEVQERVTETIHINWSHKYWGHTHLHDLQVTPHEQ